MHEYRSQLHVMQLTPIPTTNGSLTVGDSPTVLHDGDACARVKWLLNCSGNGMQVSAWVSRGAYSLSAF